MRGRTSNIKISLTGEQRETLKCLLRRQKTPVGVANRARAILLLAEGESFSQTSERVGLGERQRRLWARRFIEQGIDGLQDRPRPGRVPGFSPSSGVVFGEDGVRTPGYARAVFGAMGLH